MDNTRGRGVWGGDKFRIKCVRENNFKNLKKLSPDYFGVLVFLKKLKPPIESNKTL